MSKVIMKWNKKSSEWKIFSKTNIKFGTKYQASAIPLTSGIKSWCNDDSSLLPRGSGKCESKCGIAKSQIPVQSRITGGKATIINQYPWMAMIIMKEDPAIKQICGGTLITSRWVLTAAHCFGAHDVGEFNAMFITPGAIYVRLGEHDRFTSSESSLTKDFEVDTIVLHPSYTKQQVSKYTYCHNPSPSPSPKSKSRVQVEFKSKSKSRVQV